MKPRLRTVHVDGHPYTWKAEVVAVPGPSRALITAGLAAGWPADRPGPAFPLFSAGLTRFTLAGTRP